MSSHKRKKQAQPAKILPAFYYLFCSQPPKDESELKRKTKPFTCKAPKPRSFALLLAACKPTQERPLVRKLWNNQGVKTDELEVKFNVRSNNFHALSQAINPRIIPLGWVIAKYPKDGRSESWSWYIEPVSEALQKPINKPLRRTIQECIERGRRL